jgi:hypothetical protein
VLGGRQFQEEFMAMIEWESHQIIFPKTSYEDGQILPIKEKTTDKPSYFSPLEIDQRQTTLWVLFMLEHCGLCWALEAKLRLIPSQLDQHGASARTRNFSTATKEDLQHWEQEMILTSRIIASESDFPKAKEWRRVLTLSDWDWGCDWVQYILILCTYVAEMENPQASHTLLDDPKSLCMSRVDENGPIRK